MKKKIVLIPLDERPCNSRFVERLFKHEDFDIVSPKVLGNKKEPADHKLISDFMRGECADADAMILSMDMLIYGGLIPSRIHNDSEEILLERMSVLKKIKEENPKIKIYAFQVIMRCPDYSSSDEEPDYYEQYGEMIHRIGVAIHKTRMGLTDAEDVNSLMQQMDEGSLVDYVARRETNRYMNVETLQYLRDGVIDALVIPQDDSSRYGYAAMDQEDIRSKISEYEMMDKVLIYPGADEVELTLMSRMLGSLNQKKPKIYLKYISDEARDIIPLYEGSSLSSTLKSHVLSAGCQLTQSYEYADIVLIVTAPAANMEEASLQPSRKPEYYSERNLAEMIDFIKDSFSEKRIITIADNAYANGGDMEILHLLNNNDLLMKIDGYAGWNTSANTIGTAIAEAVDSYYYGKSSEHQSFLAQRYLEDAGYCGLIRSKITKNMLPEMNMDYFDVHETDGEAAELVHKELDEFLQKDLSSISKNVTITKVALPWRRMFEVNLEAKYHC